MIRHPNDNLTGYSNSYLIIVDITNVNYIFLIKNKYNINLKNCNLIWQYLEIIYRIQHRILIH